MVNVVTSLLTQVRSSTQPPVESGNHVQVEALALRFQGLQAAPAVLGGLHPDVVMEDAEVVLGHPSWRPRNGSGGNTGSRPVPIRERRRMS